MIAALDKILVPWVRWVLRRRMERAVARLNQRLEQPITPFKLLERHDRILRLIYDPQVLQAVVEYARANNMPEQVAFDRARRYAREIVPGFSATLYFGVAARLARLISQALYTVRVGTADPEALRRITPDATVIFIMNHRSNMDYVLVTWLVSERMMLSYAVGEWARVWPLSGLARGMGAYFIRRRHMNALYRKVLERFVQMTTAEGVAQAIFPEGGLSLNGRVGPAKRGLLGHILGGFDPAGPRDVVFIPVGLSYDRVIEDRILTEAHEAGGRRFRARPLVVLGFAAKVIWRKLRGRFPGFGHAAVSFGAPLSLRDHLAAAPGTSPDALAERLMAEVRRVVPVLPVPLVAAALLDGGPVTRAGLTARVAGLRVRLKLSGAILRQTDAAPEALTRAALRPLVARGIVSDRDGFLSVAPGMAGLLAFHAAPARQALDAAAALKITKAPDPPSAET